MEEVYKNLEEVINCIRNSSEYQMCISLKEKMNTNEEIKTLVEQMKDYQKKYIRSGYDPIIKEEMTLLEKRLEEIPIYSIYNSNLERVNEMITYVKESLNDYFFELLNKKY